MKRFLPVAVAVVSLCGIRAPMADAAFPGSNGKIAYSQLTPFPSQVHSINPDGTGSVTLTRSGNNFAPDWSIGGEIAFIHVPNKGSAEIMEMGANGHNKQTILDHMPHGFPHPSPVTWSPDGTELAFCASGRTGDRVFTVNTDGTALSNVSGRHDDCDPEWSPDGQHLVVSTSTEQFGALILMMNTDGSGRTRITRRSHRGFQPDWSPDGTRIVFVTFNGSRSDIATIRVNGRGFTLVTDTPGRYEFCPAYSPDGTQIVFSRTQKKSLISPDDLWTVNPDGTNPVRLTTTQHRDEFFPDWQPT
jgi:Tol biopolymer transport system component